MIGVVNVPFVTVLLVKVKLVGRLSVTAPVAPEAAISFAVPEIVVGSAVQPDAAPDAATPAANSPAEQSVGSAASAVAVPALPETLPVALPMFGVVNTGEVASTTAPLPVVPSDRFAAAGWVHVGAASPFSVEAQEFAPQAPVPLAEPLDAIKSVPSHLGYFPAACTPNRAMTGPAAT